jgi:hypothetical protein
MPKQRQLIEHSDFQRYQVFQQPIIVYQDNEILDENIIIKSHNNTTVESSTGNKYIKAACQFYSM